MPNGMIGAPCAAHARTTALTSAVVSGNTTASGSAEACHDSPWL